MDEETFERIPWEHLSSKPAHPQIQGRSIVYAAGAALVVAVLAFALGRGQQAEQSLESTLASDTTVASTLLSTTSVALAETTTTTLLSEAALMAVPDVKAEAAAWAEWITEAYFTVDGSADALAALLPAGSVLPAPVEGQRTFVESARSISVAEQGSSYRVTVLARLLGAVGSAAYERLPDRALVWNLRWEPGGWVVVDLPEAIAAPVLVPGPGFATGPVPEPILSAAGQRGSVVGGSQVGDLWRVVVTVTDQLGGSWPVVVWFAPDGTPVLGS